jgi:hypothetical protein
MSASPPTADIPNGGAYFRFVPQPDSCTAAMLIHPITLSARARVLAGLR